MNKEEKNLNSRRILSNIIDEILISIVSAVLLFILCGDEMIGMFTNTVSATDMDGSVNDLKILICSSIVSIVTPLIWCTVIPMLNKNRATPGKLFLGLRVIREDDKTPGYKNLLIRNIRLWIEIISIVLLLLSLIEPIMETMTIISGIYSFAVFVLYIYLIIRLSKGNIAFHDKYARTIVVDKMYDPNVDNFQTIEEIKEWADVKGFEKKEYEYNPDLVENPNIEKDPEDNDYWD